MIIVPDGKSMAVPQSTLPAKVQRVFDGDGFLASVWHPDRATWVGRIPFRFAFSDAPEMAQPFGPEARNFLCALIAGRTLSLVPILKGSTSPTLIDGYGRVLCVPFLTEVVGAGPIDYYWDGRHASGLIRAKRQVTRNIELEMVVNGWAWVIERYEFEHESEYLAAQDDARRDRRGLWSKADPEPPWNFKRRQKRARQESAVQGRLL